MGNSPASAKWAPECGRPAQHPGAGRLSTSIIPAEHLEEFNKWVVAIAKAAKKKPAKQKAEPKPKPAV
jgi:hypothetical protein